MKQVICPLRACIGCLAHSGVLIIIALFILIPANLLGQKRCTNAPTLTLNGSSSTACYMTTVTVNDNVFGGSATAATITSDGQGSVASSSVSSSPFSFSYIPDIGDEGNVVTITVLTNNPLGSPCRAASATYELTMVSVLTPPVIELITQPTCTSSTGRVDFSGLPVDAGWTITASPGGMTTEGSGSTGTISNLPEGIYTFTVSVGTECISSPSSQAEIAGQPVTLPPPLPGTITAPTCETATGSVMMNGLPATGTWTLIRYPGTITVQGTGTVSLISELPPGTFNFTVTSESACPSGLSANVTIPAQPPRPSSPVIGTIIQPSWTVPMGSVILNGLPSVGTWTIFRTPGDVASTGSGTSDTIQGLEPGTYTFRVQNNSGCFSAESNPVIIYMQETPQIVITDPSPVCYPATADLTAPSITAGSPPGLAYTYWMDNLATLVLETPASVPEGVYYIKGTNGSGFFDIKPVNVTVRQMPVAVGGSDQVLAFQFNTVLDASLGEGESGIWHSDSVKVVFSDAADPHSAVSNLSSGNNILSWIVTNDICPADTDKVSITVGELVIPTLITPNGDNRNEFFIINGLETLGRTELTVFDRRGLQIYNNSNYDNKWNGVDFNNNPLMNDTYFFVLKAAKGKSYSGYILIRR